MSKIVNRSKGSLMIEISVAIFMILVCFLCYEHSRNILLNVNDKRLERHNREVALDALSKEVEYNAPYYWIKEKLTNKEIILKYNESFLNDIENRSIEELNETNEEELKRFHIKANVINEDYIEIEVKLISEEEVIEKSIIKYSWMDYV